MSVPIDDRARLTPSERCDLERALAPLQTLEDVVRWGLGETPTREILAVFVQDEFTHDVIISFGATRTLVFDTT